jgi:hypothetical protein
LKNVDTGGVRITSRGKEYDEENVWENLKKRVYVRNLSRVEEY